MSAVALTTVPSARQSSNSRQDSWKRPWTWLEDSMPVPLTRPPTVRSSISGTMGRV